MSAATKKRYITNKVGSEFYELVDEDIIAQVRQSRGNNLHEVLDQNGDSYVVSMPTKFRKSVWLRRDQFVVVRPITEGDKVKGEIEYILDQDNVLYIRELGKWPTCFEENALKMTREAKRGQTSDKMIDDDMLPPSESEEEDESEGEETYDEDDVDDEEEEEFDTYNPNRMQAPSK
ncbi:putative RNA-binding protein EIF1AD [Caenorhabditis elegans]|uniref:Probable RNA-binding protein EIF1AD n=1 Tax=Caenorhabditis elegans TaxID=6239 RepID=EIF1A_CAEEL|nr:putative RNA-binding protein EIF1AD [Caenorhabditis elegans]Q23646.1 RecName: Full=Probable RNA-binding protein EIF1AD; AltName: Full=Eukaryotic translation initiation factor 1A domain-containing protein [Caenorhabditis elegans]CAA94859.1 Probable RNA-binding protein EIF1AD [Caenorhabditis elegans]|eukprot:NP_505624.1 Probable RNA-binding protein EIF1AD [Caenorhabditis elegans]